MLFNSPQFLVYLPITLLLFHLLPLKWKNRFLLVASYVFYGIWNWKFAFLLIGISIWDYYCGKKLANRSLAPKAKNFFFILSISANLAVLGFFKYYDFFVTSFSDLCQLFGINASIPVLSLILPIGISFHTFQTMAYITDIKRGHAKPCESLVLFMLYVAYFPQLVAGPIERADRLLPQLETYRFPTRQMIREGFVLVIIGFIKKVVLSDNISSIADHAFANYQTLPSIELWEGILVFALQIYFDFSGYSDIARGISKWCGIELVVNFKQPYLAQNVTEFWRRWHVSLSSWLRDYLYIPLGGNRKGKFRSYVNLMATMLLGGLWHGANITFVIWGLLHGLYLSLHKMILKVGETKKLLSLGELPIAAIKILFTNLLVLITWIFFRAPNIHVGMEYLRRMFTFEGAMDFSVLGFVTFMYGLLYLIDYPIYRNDDEFVFLKLPTPIRISCAIVASFVILFLILNQREARPFIYFQF